MGVDPKSALWKWIKVEIHFYVFSFTLLVFWCWCLSVIPEDKILTSGPGRVLLPFKQSPQKSKITGWDLVVFSIL